VVGSTISGFAFLLVTGHYINDGAVVLTLSAGHGLHLGDLFVTGGWAVGMTALFVLTRGHRRPRPH
jgi:hypothetical protein